MARLDRLSTGRAVAQLGAVLGRAFAYKLIRAMALMDEATVQRGLAQLVGAELLYQRGRPPQATYRFKHALIQEAAYQSLFKSTRQQSHQRITQVLTAQFPEVVETQPELLAQHYTEAGLGAQAIPYWQRAGERAIERSAYLEARAHLTMGLEVLKTVPDTPERTPQELGLQTTLGWVLIATQGGASPDVERAYARARELCRQVGETPQLFPTLRGLHRFYLGRGQMGAARELGEQLLSLAQRVQDPVLLVPAHLELGNTLFSLGELVSARTHSERTWRFYLAMLAEVYQGLGQAEAGLNVLAEALAEAHTTLARYYEAELDRLKGELLLVRFPKHYEEAEACFRQAVATARRLQAKSLELRAAMSLSRLWQHQGKRAEARELLVPVYDWFTEGFDTADLRAAKALLEELSCYGKPSGGDSHDAPHRRAPRHPRSPRGTARRPDVATGEHAPDRHPLPWIASRSPESGRAARVACWVRDPLVEIPRMPYINPSWGVESVACGGRPSTEFRRLRGSASDERGGVACTNRSS